MALNIKHPCGFEYPIVPFLWNYTDFSNPFPTHSIVHTNKQTFIKVIRSKNIRLNRELESLNDVSTQFIIHVQYKQEKFVYEGNPNDIYLGYHGWCHYGKYNDVILTPCPDMYFFNTGIYSLEGKLNYSTGYPNKGTYKKNKPGGISIDDTTTTRVAVTHKLKDIIRFSSVNVCNFFSDYGNVAFVSVGKYFVDKDKTPINVNKKNNVVVLHIFRNVADNDPDNANFMELLNMYGVLNFI